MRIHKIQDRWIDLDHVYSVGAIETNGGAEYFLVHFLLGGEDMAFHQCDEIDIDLKETHKQLLCQWSAPHDPAI